MVEKIGKEADQTVESHFLCGLGLCETKQHKPRGSGIIHPTKASFQHSSTTRKARLFARPRLPPLDRGAAPGGPGALPRPWPRWRALSRTVVGPLGALVLALGMVKGWVRGGCQGWARSLTGMQKRHDSSRERAINREHLLTRATLFGG